MSGLPLISGLPLSAPYLYVLVKITVLVLTLLLYWFVSAHSPIHPIV